MKQEQNITIKIADLKPVAMTIRPAEEETIRKAERAVNELWKAWCARFTERKPSEVMALVAFQFARALYAAEHQQALQAALLDRFEAELDRLLAAAPPEVMSVDAV